MNTVSCLFYLDADLRLYLNGYVEFLCVSSKDLDHVVLNERSRLNHLRVRQSWMKLMEDIKIL